MTTAPHGSWVAARLREPRDSDTMPCPREASPTIIMVAVLEAALPYPELRGWTVHVCGPAERSLLHVYLEAPARPRVVGGRVGSGTWRHFGDVRRGSWEHVLADAQALVIGVLGFVRREPSAPGCPVCAVLGSCGTCRGEGMSPEIAAPASVLQGEPQGLTGAGERTPLPQGWTWDHQYPICANGPDRTFAMVRARDTHLGPAGSVYTDIRELRLKAQVLAALRTEAARLGLPWCGPEQTLGGVR